MADPGSDSRLRPYTVPKFWSQVVERGSVGGDNTPLVKPSQRVHLMRGSHTAVEPFALPELPQDTPPLYLKRDDQTGGIESMGNKTRKLEFLLADAITRHRAKKLTATTNGGGHQRQLSILTAGGTQSNHVRQTAAACARLGIPAHALIRIDSPGSNGNVLLNRLFNISLYPLPADTIKQYSYKGLSGRPAALEELRTEIYNGQGSAFNPRQQATTGGARGEEPYFIPVGGSNAVGTWGYIEAVNEMMKYPPQTDLWTDPGATRGGAGSSAEGVQFHHRISDVVCSVGSGGTIAGLALGFHCINVALGLNPFLNGDGIRVRGYGVCDSPDDFYDVLNKDLFPQLVGKSQAASSFDARKLVDMRDAQGLGYSKSTTEELQFLSRVARESGVLFDRCYSAKGLLGMWKDLKSGDFGSYSPAAIGGGNPGPISSRGICYVHTGGGPSAFDALDMLNPLLGTSKL